MDGVINVHKPAGMTSSDVVVWLRKHLRLRKIGHTGTLDPEVRGVLPVCVGRGTRLVEYLTGQGKTYRTEITFGIVTDTQDAHGKVLHSEKPDILEEDLIAVLPRFCGRIQQIPPMYSAVRYQGKHLYELARRGIEVQRSPREVQIERIELISWRAAEYPRAILEVDCSKGTYIRTLCHDIGEALGCGAHMSNLVRLRSGPFRLEESWTLEQIEAELEQGHTSFLIPLNRVLDLPVVLLSPERAEAFRNGLSTDRRRIEGGERVKEGPVQVLCGEELIGIGRWQGQSLHPLKVFR